MEETQPGRATAIGSLPGQDMATALRTVFDVLGEPPHLPYLPELPARGPGSDVIGRGTGFLVDLPVDLQPSGWRLVDRPGHDAERTRGRLRHDLDLLAEVADGYTGPLKVQVTGPWTLAASVQLPRLERAVVDPGACRDIVDSLAEGVSRHVLEVRRLVPGAQVVVQVDEPSLSTVLAGGLPTASGFGRLRPVERTHVVDGLRAVLSAAGEAGAAATAVHCCVADAPVAVLAQARPGAVSLDVTLLGASGWETLAAEVESGVALWAGVVPATGPLPTAEAAVQALWTPWRRLGLAAEDVGQVVLTPTCGLAGASPAAARAVVERCVQAARSLAERAEG